MQDKRRWLPRWQRIELAEKCLVEGMTRRQAAAWRRVSVSTVQYWVERRRAASADQIASGEWAADRPSRPRWQPRLTSPGDHDRVCAAHGLGAAPDRVRGRDAALDGVALSRAAWAIAGAQAAAGGGAALRVALPRRAVADGHQALPALHPGRPRGHRRSFPQRCREADARRPRVRALDA